MTTNDSQETKDMNSLPDEDQVQKPQEYIGEQVAGVWVVSGEDMPALAALEEFKGEYIISGGILGKKEKTITYAHPKYMKTMLEIWKGMCVATGEPFFDYSVKQGRVLYLGMEDTLVKLSNRVTNMKKQFPSIGEFKFAVLPTDKRHIIAIESQIAIQKPVVVIIDPLTNLLKREDKKEDVESLLKEFDRLIEQYEISTIIIHHARKGKGETLESMRGSSALTGWADTICRIERRDNSKTRIKLDFECRHAVEEVEQLKLNFSRDDCCFVEDTTLVGDLQSKIQQTLLATGGQMPLSALKIKFEDEASLRSIERAIKGMTTVYMEIDTEDRRRRTVKLSLAQVPSTRGIES